VDFQRLCDVAAVMECTPTALAVEAIVHVVDQIADSQMAG